MKKTKHSSDIVDILVEVHALHLTKPTVKKIMNYSDFIKLKIKNGYRYVVYQVGWNPTIL